jgi:anaerobic ribonucleoside-triphosphate reductase activating protein
MNKLKYSHYDVVFQEVPNEISLVFNISDCPYKCEGCHSKYLWDYLGSYISNDIDNIIKKYNGLITCVCFMGGDQNIVELTELLFNVKYAYKLKSCVYSGNDNIHTFDNILIYLDYLKVGRYIENLGGLDKDTTNQKFYKVIDSKLEDITTVFKKE